jgi:hypothetical protein
MKIINYITSLIVLFIGCNGKNHGLSDYTIKIDNLIKHNRIVINIDTLPEENNYKLKDIRRILGDKKIINEKRSELAGITKFQNYIYVADAGCDEILMLDTDYKLIDKIGNTGCKPLQFKKPFNICNTKNNIFIYDLHNGRIQVLNKKMQYITSIPCLRGGALRNIFVNEKLLGFPKVDTDSNQYNLYNSSAPFKETNKLPYLPKLDENSKYPLAINNITGTISKNSTMYFAYTAFPFLFVYDSMSNHLYTIEIQSKILDAYNININKHIEDNQVPLLINKICCNDNKLILQIQNYFVLFNIDGGKLIPISKIKYTDKPSGIFFNSVIVDGQYILCVYNKNEIGKYNFIDK